MNKHRMGSVGPWAAFVFYVAIALEVVIMITPFTGYFYLAYAPVLGFLEARPATAWLTAFFLPHISDSGDPLLTALAVLGPVLLGLGLIVFFVCAFQVYSAKLLRRGVVSGGLYARVRHPQYLGLAIAGLGLLLYWPRFLILVLYVAMLFVYYMLARDEEGRMERRHGDSYRRYVESVPLFVPGSLGGRWIARRGGGKALTGWGLAAAFGVALLASLGVAAAARAYSRGQLTTLQEGNLVAVSLTGGAEATLRARLNLALEDPQVQERLGEHPADHTVVAYVLPQDYMMQHLIADLGEHEAHHGGGGAGGLAAAIVHLLDMYALKPRRQLRVGADSPQQRVIFTMAETPTNRAVPAGRALAADVLRLPLFFTDLDGTSVLMTMDTPGRSTWGTIPLPAF